MIARNRVTALMARKKSQRDDVVARDRIDMRADPAWVARIERQAARFGITVTAYVKQAVSRTLELDEASDPQLEQPESHTE